MSEDPQREVADRAEQAVIGSFLVVSKDAGALLARVDPIVAPDHFYRPGNAAVMSTIAALIAEGHTSDSVSVAARMLETDPSEFQSLGGGSYLHTCEVAARPESVIRHAEIIAFDYLRRSYAAAVIKLKQLAEAGNLAGFEAAIADIQGLQTARRTSGARVVDLSCFLDGSYDPPEPQVGAERDDGVRLFYPGRWHTLIGLTTAGKSWMAAWHAADEMVRGNVVFYAHFEEASPLGTISRLRSFGISDDMLRKQFVWLDCSTRWEPGQFARVLAAIPQPTFGILDGINAACGQHGWPVDKTEGVGAYRAAFVAPATALGAAVLSLGHPPKSRERQNERHSFGSTAWLDEVDGAGFRLEASKKEPLRRGRTGSSALYVVKDRYGQVDQHGVAAESRESGWFYLGSFVVDSSDPLALAARLTVPSVDEDGTAQDAIDVLGEAVLYHLVRNGGRFTSQKQLGTLLRAKHVTYADKDLAPALERLADRGRIAWPIASPGQSRSGWVTSADDDPEGDD